MQFGESAARNPKTTQAKLARLARSSNPAIAEAVAGNPATPQTSLRALAASPAAKVVHAIAGNPSTPGDTLQALAGARDPAIRAAVAANTATPATALADLIRARDSSDQIRTAVARNPTAPASVLGELAKVRSEWDLIRVAVAAHQNSSGDTLAGLLDTRGTASAINRALAENRATPTPVRSFLFDVDELRKTVTGTEPLEPVIERVAYAKGKRYSARPVFRLLAQDRDPQVRRAVATSQLVSSEVLEALSRDDVPAVAIVAIARSSSDASELIRLADGDDVAVLEALARNLHTPIDVKPAIARALVPVADDVTLVVVAQDASTPHDVFESLAVHPSSGVRNAVAMNPSVPARVLRVLATDDDPRIRTITAKSSAVPLDSLVTLASDADASVRTAVAANPSTPTELLLRLAADETPGVAEAIAGHEAATAAVLKRVADAQLESGKRQPSRATFSNRDPEFPVGPLSAVASNSKSPAETLSAIAESVRGARARIPSYGSGENALEKVERVWRDIAKNPNAPTEVLDQIARIAHKEIWANSNPNQGMRNREGLREGILTSIVRNLSTSVETLEFLGQGDWVARRITTKSEREDGHTSTWKVWDLYATAADQAGMARLVRAEISRRQWKGGEGLAGRLEFARNSDASSEILDELASDPDAIVRRAVAANPSTSPEAFLSLAGDPDDEIRLTAANATHPDAASAKHDSYSYRRKSREVGYREAFELLAQDAKATVRLAVVLNAEVFWNVMSDPSASRMAFDADPAVRAAIIESISTRRWSYNDHFGLSPDALAHLIRTGSPEVWRVLAGGRVDLPSEVLKNLVDTEDSETTALVAQHHRVPKKLLLRLASSDDTAVVDAVASRGYFHLADSGIEKSVTQALLRNPLAPGKFLIWAARYADDVETLNKAIQHANMPEELLMEFAKGTDERSIRAVARAENRRAIRVVAENPAAPVDLLESLAADADDDLREALLLNANTPPTVLVLLIQAGEQTG